VRYRGYTARYEFDATDRVFHGRVAGIRDIVTFVADRLEDLEREFQISVDDYLAWCEEDGSDPDRPAENPPSSGLT
jgi:predicted HicB family RNase H-like nuclease